MEATNQIMLLPGGGIKTRIRHDRLLQTSAVSLENNKEQGKAPEVKLENKLPSIYTNPIFKPKDYDPL